mgnify:CR=1 FL=1
MVIKMFFLAGFVALAGCGRSNNDVVAKVGSMKISQAEFRRKLADVAQNYQNYVITPNGRRQFLDVLIREKLVLAAAHASDVERSPEFRVQLERLRAEEEERLKEGRDYLLTRLWLEDLRQKGVLRSVEDEVRDYHRRHPMEVEVRHILLATPSEAEALARKVRGSGGFAALANALAHHA